VVDPHANRPEEPEEAKEAAEHKATFLHVLKGLEAARKYMCPLDTENTSHYYNVKQS
jgi:hypothetical protein